MDTIAEQMRQQALENMTKCPYCSKVNPEIRRIVAFANERGITVMYSCKECKRILNLETILHGPDPLIPPKEPETKAA